ncbi:hypothetical protein HRI_003197400 [Hibiscus trionum]|uniref:Uncharacterized protein n=1 Tax=Hibiscus trionum TaxID=183268 RepID=A0A9W7IHD6_HIBTR|nr:hypothetical protein HRI_003197400 [Hibiscus trionum]
MLGGLYGDLPPPSDEDNQPSSNTTVWSSSAKMAHPTLRKPFSGFAPPQTVLRSQNKPKKSRPQNHRFFRSRFHLTLPRGGFNRRDGATAAYTCGRHFQCNRRV